MIIYSPCGYDDWADNFDTVPFVEHWAFQPAYATFHTNWKYGDGKQWWMNLGPNYHSMKTLDDVTYSFTWEYSQYFEDRLRKEINEYVFVGYAHPSG